MTKKTSQESRTKRAWRDNACALPDAFADLQLENAEILVKLAAIKDSMSSRLLLSFWTPKRKHYEELRDDIQNLLKEYGN